MENSMLAAFWLLSISLVLTPGADWAYVISAGMRGRAIVPALAGMLGGYLVVTLVVAAGVGALVASTPFILTALTYLGAAYLTWLGIGVLRRPSVPAAGEDAVSGSWKGWLIRGFAVSGMNPKVLLLFLALLPQFTRPDSGWPIPVQITAMGFIQMANCAVIYSLVGVGAKIVLRARPSWARRVSQFSGVAMIAIAAYLLATR